MQELTADPTCAAAVVAVLARRWDILKGCAMLLNGPPASIAGSALPGVGTHVDDPIAAAYVTLPVAPTA